MELELEEQHNMMSKVNKIAEAFHTVLSNNMLLHRIELLTLNHDIYRTLTKPYKVKVLEYDKNVDVIIRTLDYEDFIEQYYGYEEHWDAPYYTKEQFIEILNPKSFYKAMRTLKINNVLKD